MVATREPEQLNIWCQGVKLAQVDKFTHLGSIIKQTAHGSHKIRLSSEQQDQPSSSSTPFGRTLLYRRTPSWGHWRHWCGPWHTVQLWVVDLRAANICRLMSCYRHALKISWTAHTSNKSVLEEMETEQHFVMTVGKRNLQYFGRIIKAQNLCTHILDFRIDGKMLDWWHQGLDWKNPVEVYNHCKREESMESASECIHDPQPSAMRMGSVVIIIILYYLTLTFKTSPWFSTTFYKFTILHVFPFSPCSSKSCI